MTPSLRAAPACPQPADCLCVTEWLGNYLIRDKGWKGETMKGGDFIFPDLQGERLGTQAMGGDKAMRLLKQLFKDAGLQQVDTLDKHSGRPTGFNFYRWTLFLPKEEVEVIGGWTTDSTTSRHYCNVTGPTAAARRDVEDLRRLITSAKRHCP